MKKIDLGSLKEVFSGFRLSLLEWIVLGAVVAYAGYVTYFYFNSTQPLRTKLEDLRKKEKTLLAQMKDEANKKQAIDDQRNNAGKIVDSLERFESRLRSRKQGIPAIIDEVNQIAKENRVQAGDISFRTDAPAPLADDLQPGASPKSTATPALQNRPDKILNVYEGLGIDTTVEGDYQDLRRFISALERSHNFVIINEISLQSIDEKARAKFRGNLAKTPRPQAAPGQPGQPGPPGQPTLDAGDVGQDGGVSGPSKILVSLKIMMETHFAREVHPELTNSSISASAPVKSTSPKP